MNSHDWLLAVGSSVATAAAGLLAQLATGRLARTLLLLPLTKWVSRRGTPQEAELLHEARIDLGLDYAPTYVPPQPSAPDENTGVHDGHE